MQKNSVETVVLGNKVTYKRLVDVPVALVFEAWSEPAHLDKWWGPDGFTLTTKRMAFSEGGIWEFVMHGPHGHDYKNKVQFVQIQKPNLIVYKHLGDGDGDSDVNFEARIILEEAGQGTALTFEQIFPNKAELERVNAKYGAIEGAKQHIGNLCKFLESLGSTSSGKGPASPLRS